MTGNTIDSLLICRIKWHFPACISAIFPEDLRSPFGSSVDRARLSLSTSYAQTLFTNLHPSQMGARHNRRRTRSRPRNRNSAQKSRSFINLSSPLIASSSPTSSSQRSGMYWHQQYSQWQDRLREQQQHQALHEQQEAAAAEAQRLRIFGGEAGDEVSLCAPMLQVVMGLFNGRLDYEDP